VLRLRESGAPAPLPHTESLAVTAAHGFSLDIDYVFVLYTKGNPGGGKFFTLTLERSSIFLVTYRNFSKLVVK